MSKKYYQSLPKKRMGVGALFFNRKGEMLFVRPTYKDHWSIPGGCIDVNESPRQACAREIKEEIGLSVTNLKFLCVDYKYPTTEKTESLQFMFYGGVLSARQIKAIKLPARELSGHTFLVYKKMRRSLNKFTARRIAIALLVLKNGAPMYLEDTRAVGKSG
jgi:8-oxo-dGTP diphosphatase